MIGDKLKALRKARGMTQQELGELLDISASAIGMYEQGRRGPDNAMLTRLCKIFCVSSDYLLLEAETPARNAELQDVIEEFRRRLLMQEGLMFNGEPLSEADIAQVVSAIEVGTMVAVNKLSKEKLTQGGSDGQN